MTSATVFKQGKAVALLAHALDIGAPHAIENEALNALVDAVCEDANARAELIAALTNAQNRELPSVVVELLGSRLDRMRDRLDLAADNDQIWGLWSQRLAGGTILASGGLLVSQAVNSLLGTVLLSVALAFGVATSYCRARLRKMIRHRQRRVEQTERMIEVIKASIP